MNELTFDCVRVLATRVRQCAVLASAVLCLAACKSQSCSGPQTFVLDGAENPRVDFVEVPEGPLAQDSPAAKVETDTKAEPDERVEPSDPKPTEPEPEVAEAASDVTGEDEEAPVVEDDSRDEADTPSPPNLHLESKRFRMARRVGEQSVGTTVASDEARPLLLQSAKSKADSQAADDEAFSILRQDDPTPSSSRPEPSSGKIEKANTSVQMEVTFGNESSLGPSSSAEAVERRRKLARVREARKRRARERRIKEKLIEEALTRPEPQPSATSTFAIDVDTGSYTLTGRKLTRGQIPSPDEVRVEEFINFFDYDYPEAEGAFGLTVEGAPSPFREDPNTYLVRFGVKAREINEDERRPQHITLVFDVSHSMGAADAMPVAKKSALVLFDALDPEDTVSVVGYASQARLIASRVPAAQRDKLLLAMSRLGDGSSSALQNALELGYAHSNTHSSAETNSRVMLFSDGATGLDDVDGERMARELDEYRASDVGLIVLGVGADIYNDAWLESIANHCDGRYHHVNAPPEAHRLFGDEFDATLYTVAKDAKIQVVFESETVKSFRKIGYENRDIPDEFFRRDDVDAGEVGAGESVTALYEIEVHPGASGELGELRVRFNEPGGVDGKELGAPFRTDDLASSFSDATDDLRFAASLAALAEILKRTVLGYALDIDSVIEVAVDAAGDVDERKSAVYLMRRLVEISNRR